MLEIERKFLLRDVPKNLHELANSIVEVKQGYISSDTIVERISKRKFLKSPKHPNDFVKYSRTIKIGHGLVREEFKEEVSKDFFRLLWPITKEHRVLKRRSIVPVEGGLEWEIDVFLDRQLYMAEIETPEENTKIVIPNWLEPFIKSEVTDNQSYEGTNLAF